MDAGLRIGRYEVLARVASGGMGEIFHARATGAGAFEKRVALKLLLPHLAEDPEFVKMFLDEARIAAQMNHPNVVQIFDLGEANGRYFIAMALVEGVSLSLLLKAARQRSIFLTVPEWRLVAASLCDALTHAHELRSATTGEPLKIIHRDVSPGNLLVSRQGTVLLTDFGIARAENNLYRTKTGAATRGKYPYMAPEQLSSKNRVDHRADLFSAAVTLYEALTLVSPFRRGTDAEVMDAVRKAPLPDPRKFRAGVPDEVVVALNRATARNPDERFGSARELRAALCGGEVAAPEELGSRVEALCGDLLTRYTTGTGAGPSPGPRTYTVAPKASTASITEPNRQLRTVGLAAIAAVALLVAGAAGAIVWARAFASDRAVASSPEALHVAGTGPTASSGHSSADGSPSHSGADGTVSTTEASSEGIARPGGDPPARGSAGTAEGDALHRAAEPPSGADPAHAGEDSTVRLAFDSVATPARQTNADGARTDRPPRGRTVAVSESSTRKDSDPVRVGYLTADAEPWAWVARGDSVIDRTPISRYPLPVGTYDLVFRNAELHKEIHRTVKIREGKVEILKVNLTR